MDELELDFMTGLLCMDPAKRLTGRQCLQHPYLSDLAKGGSRAQSAASALAGGGGSFAPSHTSDRGCSSSQRTSEDDE